MSYVQKQITATAIARGTKSSLSDPYAWSSWGEIESATGYWTNSYKRAYAFLFDLDVGNVRSLKVLSTVQYSMYASSSTYTATCYLCNSNTPDANVVGSITESGSGNQKHDITWDFSSSQVSSNSICVVFKSGGGDTWFSNPPTITYQIEAPTSHVVPLNSPTGGNVNASDDITFACTLMSDGAQYEFTMASATFYWRSQESDPYTQVSMTPDGANASVVITGGTFPSGSVYWYISATDTTGTSTQTDVYTISTIASRIDASPVAPVGVIETKNTPTTFTWRYASVTGSEQKAAQLQYSTDGGDTWLTLGSVTGTATSYTAAANALPSGTITWRVRAQNTANEWGDWSDPVSYVNFGAPDVTSVLTDDKPYTTITWQVNDQESYKIFVDGVQIGPYHGEDVRSYTLMQPLANGQHTVQVQVQNEYSQWSPINGTVFDVVNTPTASVHLRHHTAVDVALSWTGGDGTGDFYVYRDGLPIAHTGGMEHLDRVALGSHEYYVIEKLASGDYNRSNTLTATPDVECPMIALLSGGAWLPLALSTNSERLIQISDEVRTAERFVLGADFPVVTIGRHRSRRVSLDAAWLRSSCQNNEFVALLGKPVILKLPRNGVIIGVLPAYAQSNARFTSGYSYSISQADWRDYIDNA